MDDHNLIKNKGFKDLLNLNLNLIYFFTLADVIISMIYDILEY